MLEIADRVIAGIKVVRDVAKRIENAELQNHIADLMCATADLKMELAELKAEIIKVNDENQHLKRKADLRLNMVVRDRLLYPFPEPEIPGYGPGPFCPICFEKEGILIAVRDCGSNYWLCPACEKSP